MKPQTTNYDLFRISRYLLLLGSCIASISCGSGCKDFGLKNIASTNFDADWEFYSFVNMDISGCFLCARWQSEERKTFELLFPCVPEDATGFINLNYFYSPSTTINGNIAFIWQRFTDNECKSFNGVTSAISGGQATYNSTVLHGSPIRIQVLPENSNEPIVLRISNTYPEDTIFCIEGFDSDIPTVPIPTSATNSESSGPKESSPTEIKELLRTSKTTENPAAATISESSGPKESSPTEFIELPRTSKIIQTSDSDKNVPVTSEKHSLIGLSSTLNTEELRTFEQQREADENNNGGMILWIIIVAVVVILFLFLGFVGLLGYRSRRQKGEATHPVTLANNGTNVSGNQLVNHHDDENDQMVYNPVYETQDDDVTSAENEYNIVDEKMNGNHNLEPLSTNYASINDKVFSRKSNPNYYSVEDGKVKIPTEALSDQEMVDKNDSYETVGMKAVGSESKTKSDDSESSEITNTMKGTSSLYSEVKMDGNGAVPQIKGDLTHQNEVLATKLTDETLYGKIDENKENANGKIVDEASIKEENGYSEVKDSLKRNTQLYSEVAADEEGPSPREKESVTRGFNIQTKTVPGVPLYGKIDKTKQKTENANDKNVSDTLLVEEDEYSEVQDAMKRKTQLYSEINSDEKKSVPQIKGTMAQRSEAHPTKSFDTPLYGKIDKNKQKA